MSIIVVISEEKPSVVISEENPSIVISEEAHQPVIIAENYPLISLNELSNVSAGSPVNNQAISYNSVTNTWVPRTIITVSDTAPSDPEVNDLWFDTSS